MNPPDRPDAHEDRESDDLYLSARAAARRAIAAVTLGQRRSAPETYLRAAHRASELLEDAAESIRTPGFQIRGLSGATRDARAIALAMSSSNEPHATSVAAPTALMSQQAGVNVLSGSSRAVAIPELLEFLGTLKKSGIVWIRAAAETFTLQLEDGFLVHASSSESPRGSRLGDIMIKMGFVTQDRLDEFLANFIPQSGKLGIALENAGVLTREQLTEALEQQVRVVLQRLFAVESSTFSFSARGSNSQENRIRLGIDHLLRKGAPESDEDQGAPGRAVRR